MNGIIRLIETGKLFPAPFRACPDMSGGRVKRGKSKKVKRSNRTETFHKTTKTKNKTIN